MLVATSDPAQSDETPGRSFNHGEILEKTGIGPSWQDGESSMGTGSLVPDGGGPISPSSCAMKLDFQTLFDSKPIGGSSSSYPGRVQKIMLSLCVRWKMCIEESDAYSAD